MAVEAGAPQHLNVYETSKNLPKVWRATPHARINDQEVTLMRVQGQFYWHVHDSEEMFYIVDGEVSCDVRAGSTCIDEEGPDYSTHKLVAGDVFVVPRNTAHRSTSDGASVMFILQKNALLFMKDDEKDDCVEKSTE